MLQPLNEEELLTKLAADLNIHPPLMTTLPHTACVMMTVKPMKELWQSLVDLNIGSF